MSSEELKERLMKPWQQVDAENRFLQYYVCKHFSDSHASHNHLDNSNKVILPASALDRLMTLGVDFPMMFSMQNPCNDCFFSLGGRATHCGVNEFTSEEGCVHMPRWMMSMLGVEEGHLVFFTNIFALPKGIRIKIQPHKTEFLAQSDHKTVLEKALRGYSCLTAGDAISIIHNGKEYVINIVETTPAPAVDIIDTDCEVDFEAPLDYEEPEKVPKKKAKVAEKAGVGDGESKFVGTARRLDGTVLPPPPPPSYGQEIEERRHCRRKSGTLAFGSNTVAKKQEKESSSKKQEKEPNSAVEPVKFQAFTGVKRTLM